jgi:hypothetical protein
MKQVSIWIGQKTVGLDRDFASVMQLLIGNGFVPWQ